MPMPIPISTRQIVRCPNCGSEAERRYLTNQETACSSCPSHEVIQTECSVCDYLMVICFPNGSVVEAYAPGLKAVTFNSEFLIPNFEF